MKRQRALVIGNNSAEVSRIESDLKRIRKVPFEVARKLPEGSCDLCFIELSSSQGIDQDLVRRMSVVKEASPEVTFVYFNGRPSERIEVTPSELTKLQKFNAFPEILNTSKRDSVKAVVESLRQSGRLKSPLHVGLVGISKVNMALLGRLREGRNDKIIERVDWYSASASGERKVSESHPSYPDVVAAKDLEDLVEEGVLRMHQTLQSFVESVSGADRIINATGPFVDKYDDDMRGETSEPFYAYLFRESIAPLALLIDSLNQHSSSAEIDNIANPNGALNLFIGNNYHLGHGSVMSSSPDDERVRKIMANWLLKIAKRRSGLFEDVLGLASRETFRQISGVRIYGEHHDPYIDASKSKVRLGDAVYPFELFLNELKFDQDLFNEHLRKKLMRLGLRTMQGSTKSRTDFSSTPSAILESLRAKSSYLGGDSARYDSRFGAYLLGSKDKNLGDDVIDELTTCARRQRELYERIAMK